MVHIRKAYDECETDFVQLGTLYFEEETLTKQCFQEECDINSIMKRWEQTGILEHVNRYEGVYGDFTDVSDYATSLQKVIEADETFMSLPAAIRARFENSPHKFLEFVNDPANREEMRQMGLLRETPLNVGVDQENAVEGVLGGSEGASKAKSKPAAGE